MKKTFNKSTVLCHFVSFCIILEFFQNESKVIVLPTKMECVFCNNIFKTESSLRYHQKTAKYCLATQGKSSNSFACEYCKKPYTQRNDLNRHQIVCFDMKISQLKQEYVQIIDQKDNQLQEQKQTIKELQDKLENIALRAVSRSTTTKNTQINNYIQNLQPVTDEHLQDNINYLSIDHILRGPEGYADYALEYPLKDRLICVDYSRRKVKFKDKDGNIITDPEMTNLATKLFNSIKDKNKELIIEYGEQLKENFGDEIDTIVKIFDYKTAVDSSSVGTKTEFHHDFVKQMCSKTIKD